MVISFNSPENLQEEAQDLEQLLDAYLDDRNFLSSRPDHHLIYFVDSHDLKAFVDPNRLQDTTHDRPDRSGEARREFAFKVERTRPGADDAAQLTLELKLKNDQIISDLVLDPGSRQAGLLRPHADELEEEIDYVHNNEVKETTKLLYQARSELAKHRDHEIRRATALAASGSLSVKDRANLLNFLRHSAPSVLALLRQNPERPSARLELLLNDSWLDLPQQINWMDFGFTTEDCDHLQRYVPPDSLVGGWQRYIDTNRPRGSWRSNRYDGEAIAWIQALNEELDKFSKPKMRALLVTSARAMRVLAADDNKTKHAKLQPNRFLRHPRFTVLNSSVDPLQQGRGASDNAEKVLKIALETYREQISLLQKDRTADQAWAEQAVDALVTAFHDFEETRFALGLRNNTMGRNAPDNLDDDDIRHLLDWFTNDNTMVDEIKKALYSSVQRFGEAIVKLRSGSEEHIRARISAVPGTTLRTRCVALIGPLIGPTNFPTPEVMPDGGEVAPLLEQLRRLAEGKPGRAAWSYLGWALLRICEGNYQAARIYISSARQIAGLLGADDTSALLNEAKLQLAHIDRLSLSILEDGAEAGRRYDNFVRNLEAPVPVADARGPIEQAASRLELHLFQPGRTASNGWPAFSRDIQSALEMAKDDSLLTAFALTFGLAGALVAIADRKPNWDASQDSFRLARGWHDQLCHQVSALSQGADATPRLALPLGIRAMAVLGFQMAWTSLPEILPGDPLPRLRIPAELRLEPAHITELWENERLGLQGLTGSDNGRVWQVDRISDRIQSALKGLANALEHHLQRDLIYAPIWVPYSANDIIAMTPGGEPRETVREAFRIIEKIAGAACRFDLFEQDRPDLEDVRKLLLQAQDLTETTEHSAQHDQDGAQMRDVDLRYFLEMEKCYIDMLLARLEENITYVERLGHVAKTYEALANRYPKASIPHFRLDIIYSEIGKHSKMDDHKSRALDHLRKAHDRIGTDPYKISSEHWVRSTIVRRLTIKRVWLAEQIKTEDPGSYIDAMVDLVIALLPYHRNAAASGDYLTNLEALRRLNNIVYIASKLLESATSEENLRRADLDRHKLRRLLEQLKFQSHGDGAPLDIIHTIVFSHHVLGEREEATRAAALFESSVTDSGFRNESMDGAMLEDVRRWTAQQDSQIPGLAASFQGFSENQEPFLTGN